MPLDWEDRLSIGHDARQKQLCIVLHGYVLLDETPLITTCVVRLSWQMDNRPGRL